MPDFLKVLLLEMKIRSLKKKLSRYEGRSAFAMWYKIKLAEYEQKLLNAKKQ